MKTIYIVDDDPSIVNILEDIINKYFTGALIGAASNGTDAIKEIKEFKPDIVLLDYMLPDQTGLQVIRSVRDKYCKGVVMISEVSDKQMIAKAYKENIEFFISKPINVIEVVSVIKKVLEHLEIKSALSQFEKTINNLKINLEPKTENSLMQNNSATDELKLKKLYSKLGLIGSNGCDDLIKAVLWAKQKKSDYVLSEMYLSLVDDQTNYKQIDAVKKRISRVITKAFKSMASLGIEDFMNPVFEEYSGRLFDFAEMRKEMNYITEKSKYSGKINVKQFVENSIVLIEEN